jgi:hypothetical protein
MVTRRARSRTRDLKVAALAGKAGGLIVVVNRGSAAGRQSDRPSTKRPPAAPFLVVPFLYVGTHRPARDARARGLLRVERSAPSESGRPGPARSSASCWRANPKGGGSGDSTTRRRSRPRHRRSHPATRRIVEEHYVRYSWRLSVAGALRAIRCAS